MAKKSEETQKGEKATPEAEIAKGRNGKVVVRIDKRAWSEVDIERLRQACNAAFGEDNVSIEEVNWNS